jgi:DNA helicase HerA-like ATPase
MTEVTDRPTLTSAPTAWSLDGKQFELDTEVADAPRLGGHVVLTTGDGRRLLGQVVDRTLREGRRGGRDSTWQVRAVGAILADLTQPPAAVSPASGFENARVVPAPPEAVEEWLSSTLRGASTLTIGRVQGSSPAGGQPEGGADTPARLIASGFNRHTFLCGQSGSGKTYTLGVLLEQLLLHTDLPLIVLDPNSDYVHLDQLQTDAVSPERLARLRRTTCVFRSDPAGERVLRVRFGRLPLRQQAMTLGLHPIEDAEEYDLLRQLSEQQANREYALSDLDAALGPARDAAGHRLALRISNLGVASWDIWAERGEAPMLDQLPADWRAAVLDLGGVAHAEERSVVAASVLASLWEGRHSKQPQLIVIDEAHNVCPEHPTDAHQALAIEHTERIAAEGRKYGLYLLLSTQSPRKLHPNVLSQCENLLLMKTNSAADVAHLERTFSHVPAGLVRQATGFRLGEGLAAGRIAPAPLLFRSGRRLTPEGGADVPTTWATITPE